MSNKAYFFQIDKNKNQLNKFVNWIEKERSHIDCWIDYLFFSKKYPNGFYPKYNQISIAFTIGSHDWYYFPFANELETILLDELRGTSIYKNPKKWIDKNGLFFSNVDEAFKFILTPPSNKFCV